MTDTPNADLAAMAAMGPIAGIAEVGLIAERAATLMAMNSPAAGGGSYKFEPAELQSVLNQWKQLQDTIRSATLNVHQTSGSVGVPHYAPGNEQASLAVGTAAAKTNTAYTDYLAKMDKYVSGYVETLTGVLNNYTGTEQDQAGSMSSTQGHLA